MESERSEGGFAIKRRDSYNVPKYEANPDAWEDVESRIPIKVISTTLWYFLGTVKGDLLPDPPRGSARVMQDF